MKRVLVPTWLFFTLLTPVLILVVLTDFDYPKLLQPYIVRVVTSKPPYDKNNIWTDYQYKIETITPSGVKRSLEFSKPVMAPAIETDIKFIKPNDLSSNLKKEYDNYNIRFTFFRPIYVYMFILLPVILIYLYQWRKFKNFNNNYLTNKNEKQAIITAIIAFVLTIIPTILTIGYTGSGSGQGIGDLGAYIAMFFWMVIVFFIIPIIITLYKKNKSFFLTLMKIYVIIIVFLFLMSKIFKISYAFINWI